MTENELIQIAESVAAQQMLVQNLGMQNQPEKAEDRVRADARYMVESDKLRIEQEKYQSALRAFTQQRD